MALLWFHPGGMRTVFAACLCVSAPFLPITGSPSILNGGSGWTAAAVYAECGAGFLNQLADPKQGRLWANWVRIQHDFERSEKRSTRKGVRPKKGRGKVLNWNGSIQLHIYWVESGLLAVLWKVIWEQPSRNWWCCCRKHFRSVTEQGFLGNPSLLLPSSVKA